MFASARVTDPPGRAMSDRLTAAEFLKQFAAEKRATRPWWIRWAWRDSDVLLWPEVCEFGEAYAKYRLEAERDKEQ